MREETCCASARRCMIITCSGGSDTGQVSNQAAVELTRERAPFHVLPGRNRSGNKWVFAVGRGCGWDVC